MILLKKFLKLQSYQCPLKRGSASFSGPPLTFDFRLSTLLCFIMSLIAVIGLSSCTAPRPKEYLDINWIYFKNVKAIDRMFQTEYEYSGTYACFSYVKRPEVFREKDKILIKCPDQTFAFTDESSVETYKKTKDVSKGTITIPNPKNLPVFVSDGKKQRLIWAKHRETKNDYVMIEGKKIYHKDYPKVSLYEVKQESLEPVKIKEAGSYITSKTIAVRDLVDPQKPRIHKHQIVHSDSYVFCDTCREACYAINYLISCKEDVESDMLKLALSKNPVIKCRAVEVLARRGYKSADPIIRDMLKSRDPRIRYMAVCIYCASSYRGIFPSPENLDIIIDLYRKIDIPDNEEEDFRRSCENLFAIARSKKTVPALIEAAMKDRYYKYPIFKALGEIGDTRAVPVLMKLHAFSALAKIGTPEAIECIIKILISPVLQEP